MIFLGKHVEVPDFGIGRQQLPAIRCWLQETIVHRRPMSAQYLVGL